MFIKAAVIGHPIAHSKSPLIHNHWIAQHGLTGSYTAIDIAPEDLPAKVRALAAEGYAGFNVTIPHKLAIMDLCAEIEETAQKIGAVNTIVIRDGKLHGRNTDAFGFIENVRQTVPGFDFSAGPCVVLGAGGAARAIIHGLIGAGAKDVILTNRTEEKAREIAKSFPSVQVAAWEERSGILTGARFLTNTTALGMKGKDPLEIDLEALPKEAVVCDIVYAPLMTELLNAAQARGNRIVTGIGMLLHQARPAFEAWFGVMPSVDPALAEKVLRA